MKDAFTIAAAIAVLALAQAAQAGGDATAGQAKSKSCAGCHGASGQGNGKPGSKLTGQSEQQIVQALADYKSGKRDNKLMKAMASGLSDQDMANLGAFYAAQK